MRNVSTSTVYIVSTSYRSLDLKLQAKMPTDEDENFLGISSGPRF